MWVDTKLSAQSSFHKLKVDNSFKNHAKLAITFFKSCPILLCFFSFCEIVCLGLSEEKNFWLELSPVPFSFELLDVFFNFKANK